MRRMMVLSSSVILFTLEDKEFLVESVCLAFISTSGKSPQSKQKIQQEDFPRHLQLSSHHPYHAPCSCLLVGVAFSLSSPCQDSSVQTSDKNSNRTSTTNTCRGVTKSSSGYEEEEKNTREVQKERDESTRLRKRTLPINMLMVTALKKFCSKEGEQQVIRRNVHAQGEDGWSFFD